MTTPFPAGSPQGPQVPQYGQVPYGQPYQGMPQPPHQDPNSQPTYQFDPGTGQMPPGPPPHPGAAHPGAADPSGGWGWAAGQPHGAPPAAPTHPDTVRKIAQILCPVLVLVGLSLPQGGSVGWVDYTLWAIFAAAMSLLQLSTLRSTRSPGQTALLATIATGALVAYWVVIVLPGISSNGGFLQTLGVGCAVVGTWLSSERR